MARLAITSLAFMFARGAGAGLIDVDGELIVEPSVGDLAAGVSAGPRFAGWRAGVLPDPPNLPKSRFAVAAAHFTSPRAWISAAGSGRPEMGKFSTARWVWLP